jgi:hypothetical protein
MSSTFDGADSFPADNAIDDLFWPPATTGIEPVAWISVKVAAESSVGFVAVYHRADEDAVLMGAFQVWIGDYFGDIDPSSATQCDGTVHNNAHLGPFLAWCGGSNSGQFVTVAQVNDEPSRLSVTELVVYAREVPISLG